MYKIVFLIFLLSVFGCKNDDKLGHRLMGKNHDIQNFNLLKQKKIYFGHQSVGDNIIDGIRRLGKNLEVENFHIINYEDQKKHHKNFFIHSAIGKNGDPKSKVDDFIIMVEKLAETNLEIALMKFCYVDIDRNTNLEEIFNYYCEAIESLKLKYPSLALLYFTVPLEAKKSLLGKFKAMVLGRENYIFLNNVARNKFNKMLLEKYDENEVFDLARYESTFHDGTRDYQILDDRNKIYFLISDYASDNGHLNELGQNILATKLVKKINSINP